MKDVNFWFLNLGQFHWLLLGLSYPKDPYFTGLGTSARLLVGAERVCFNYAFYSQKITRWVKDQL